MDEGFIGELLGQLIALAIIAVIGEYFVGYSLDTIVGVENHHWHEAGWIIRYLIGLVLSEIAIVVAITVGLISLVVGTPLIG